MAFSSKSSHKPRPAAEKLTQCDHQGCDYKCKWKSNLLSHQKQVHSEERPFACSHTGCSFRCKSKSQLTRHQNHVHLKNKTKRCHVCDKRFSTKSELRVHMMSRHQTKDHDMTDCENCVTYRMKCHTRSQALRAAHKRRAGKKGTHLTAANMQDIESCKKKAEEDEQNSFAFREMVVECETDSLNGELIDVHMDMQLLSSL